MLGTRESRLVEHRALIWRPGCVSCHVGCTRPDAMEAAHGKRRRQPYQTRRRNSSCKVVPKGGFSLPKRTVIEWTHHLPYALRTGMHPTERPRVGHAGAFDSR